MKILIIEDEFSVRLGLTGVLQDSGYDVESTDNGVDGINLLKNKDFDLVITDLRLPKADGLDVLKTARSLSSSTGVIIMTAYAEVHTAVQAIKSGAYDYISKPFDPSELLVIIERYKQSKIIEEENLNLKNQLLLNRQIQSLIGYSPAMLTVFDRIKNVAPTVMDVIIYGETGTGKELVANEIHKLSLRKEMAFIKINSSAIPDTLLESELFGYEKGAFTGAVRRKKGKFEIADKGTIFLDEIADMPLILQSKLLRVIETRSFERLGGHENIKVDVRLIYATRKDLLQEMHQGNFREDLYYRINTFPITLPPLRDRREDIPMLVNHFFQEAKKKLNKPNLSISAETIKVLTEFDYPGNVRQLKHIVETMAILCNHGIISLQCGCIPKEIYNNNANINRELLSYYPEKSLAEKLKAFERDLIIQTIKETGGKKKEAAEKLHISRETLWRKLKELSIPDSYLEQ